MAASFAASVLGAPTVSVGDASRTGLTEAAIGTLPSPVRAVIDKSRVGVGAAKWKAAELAFKAVGAKATGEEALPIPEGFDVQLCRQIQPYTDPNVIVAIGGREVGESVGLTPEDIAQIMRFVGRTGKFFREAVVGAREVATDLVQVGTDIFQVTGEMVQSAGVAIDNGLQMMKDGFFDEGRALINAGTKTGHAAAKMAGRGTSAVVSAVEHGASAVGHAVASAVGQGASAFVHGASAVRHGLSAFGQSVRSGVFDIAAVIAQKGKTARERIEALEELFPESQILHNSIRVANMEKPEQRKQVPGVLIFDVDTTEKIYSFYKDARGNVHELRTYNETETVIKSGRITSISLLSYKNDVKAMHVLMQILMRLLRYEKYQMFGQHISSISNQTATATQLLNAQFPATEGIVPPTFEPVFIESMRQYVEELEFLTLRYEAKEDIVIRNRERLEELAKQITEVRAEIGRLEAISLQLSTEETTLRDNVIPGYNQAAQAAAQNIVNARAASQSIAQSIKTQSAKTQSAKTKSSKGGARTQKNRYNAKKGGARNRSRKRVLRKSTRKHRSKK